MKSFKQVIRDGDEIIITEIEVQTGMECLSDSDKIFLISVGIFLVSLISLILIGKAI